MGDVERRDRAARSPLAPHALTAVTVTSIGWSSAQRCVATTDASIDVACLQGTWLEAAKNEAAHQWAASRRWQLALSPAERMPAGGLSEGAAVSARANHGMKYLEGTQSFDLVGGTVAPATVEVPSSPDVVNGRGMNMPPEELAEAGVAERAKLGSVADQGPMYVSVSRAASLGCYMVHASLEQREASAQRVQDSVEPCHMPVLSRTHASLVAHKAPRLCQPPKMPTKSVLGPRSRLQCGRHACVAFVDFLELRAREAPAEVHGPSPQEAFETWHAAAGAEHAAAADHAVARGRSARRRQPERRWYDVCRKIASCDLRLGSVHASVIEHMHTQFTVFCFT